MNAVTRRQTRPSVRELVLLAAGLALVAVGVTSNPRDAAVIGVGVSLLLATPALGPRDDNDPDDNDPPGASP